MDWGFSFFSLSIMLGAGLAMDAFSVSLANGLNDTKMKLGRMCYIAGIFAFFQALMPTLGWLCVTSVADLLTKVQKFIPWFSFRESGSQFTFQDCIPWISLVLLSWIGGKMLFEGIRCAIRKENCDECEAAKRLTFGALLVQGVATSIDALSVGFTIAEYDLAHALVCALVIAVVTFIICMGGLYIGKKFGTMLSNAASILGGSILVIIGFWILIKSFLG